jgi:hypothetical protein
MAAGHREISAGHERISVVTVLAADPFRLKHPRNSAAGASTPLFWQVGMLRIVQLVIGPAAAKVPDNRHGRE